MDTKPVDAKSVGASEANKAKKNDPTENLIKFAKLVVEVLKYERQGKGNVVIDVSSKYLNLICRSGMVIKQQHELFENLFTEDGNRKKILNSLKTDQDTYWAKDAPKSVEVWFGKGTKYENNKYILKISAAYVCAWKIKEDIDKRIKGHNINDQEIEKGKYEYSYTELLNYYFYLVISDALGPLHSDYEKVKFCSEAFRNRTYLADQVDDGEDSDEQGLGNTINRLAGGKIQGSKVEAAIGALAADDNLIGNFTKMMTTASEAREKGGGKGTFKDALVEMAPLIGDTLEGLQDAFSAVLPAPPPQQEAKQ